MSEWLKCPFCDFESVTVHQISKHLLEDHLDRVETNYSPDIGSWTYMNIKRGARHELESQRNRW